MNIVFLNAGVAHARPGGGDLGSGLVEQVTWWLSSVVAPAMIVIGVFMAGVAWITGGAREGITRGAGVVLAGFLFYSVEPILSFIQAAAGH